MSSSSSSSSSSKSSNSSSSKSSVSSSSSSSFSSSSSSSSEHIVSRHIFFPLINQNHGDIIPFSWIAESGVSGDGSTINFMIEASNSSYFNYSAIINRDNGAVTSTPSTTSTVYVPNDEEAKYTHEKSIYVDVVAKDKGGIRDIRTHVDPEKYDFEKAEDAGQIFMIPRFTWEENNSISTSITETVLVGTSNNALANIEYSTNGASVVYLKDVGSPVAGIFYAEQTNRAFVSTMSNLASYSINYYANSSSEIYSVLSVSNADGSLMNTYRKLDDSLWALQSYKGKVVKMNPSDLSVLTTYGEFDSPYKIRYSVFHNAYFVAGSHILWKIDSLGVITAVYEINDYILKDFDVSEAGVICMLFRGSSNDIIRIIKNDLYSLLLNQEVESETLAFCKYCNKGRFYILRELSVNVSEYSCVHYVFDSVTNKLDSIGSDQSLTLTTTTTTIGSTNKVVQVVNPSGGDQIQIGKTYDIKWLSSKGVNDAVKIELYNGNVLYDVLSPQTLNTGIFSWNVAVNIAEGSSYRVKITWLAANTSTSNSDTSGNFSILKSFVTTTTTTTTRLAQHSIGIDYSPASNQILIVLASGNYMIFELASMSSYGLLPLGVSNPTAMATRSMVVNGFIRQTKFRIFVGTEKYLSDKWDSGIIESSLQSCLYGAGNNLTPGEQYFINIQTYAENYGWGETQIVPFVFPK